MSQERYKSNNIMVENDGKYHWVYEMHLLKNPNIFLLVWKIFFFIFLVIFAFVFSSDILRWGTAHLVEDLKFLGIFFLGMTAITALGYFIYAAIMGWKYIVEFEMDETGINHKQIAYQAYKAKKLGKATAIAGAATGKLTTVSIGLNAQRIEMYSQFNKVRRVKAYPVWHVIKLNGLLEHNQVYAEAEDFEFVKNFILSHCINRKS